MPNVPPSEQDPLPLMPSVEKETFDPNRRRAFGSVQQWLDVMPEEGFVANDEDLRRASPDNLRRALFGSTRNNEYVVGNIALQPPEYKKIVRSVPAIMSGVGATALSAKPQRNLTRLSEVELKAQIATLGSKQKVHITAVDGLNNEQNMLAELSRCIIAPGYALKTESDIKIMTAGLWSNIDTILAVASRSYGWSEQETHSAQQTLLTVLSSGPQRSRMSAWKQLNNLAWEYTLARKHLFAGRLKKITQELGKSEEQLTSLHETTGFYPV